MLNIQDLFVMAHPGIRHHVDTLLKVEGLNPKFLPLEVLEVEGDDGGRRRHKVGEPPQGGQGEVAALLEQQGGAVSLLGMVEEEIASR